MRCQFCGWDNPNGKERCEKCNKPLATDQPERNEQEPMEAANRKTERYDNNKFDARATVREIPQGSLPIETENEVCPECGFELEDGVCANCGYGQAIPLNDEHELPLESIAYPEEDSSMPEGRKTMRPLRKAVKKNFKFTLTPISEETGMEDGEPLEYDGAEVVLNRNNTDPANQTITSQSQAVVECDGNVWTIKDSSEYKTTFVQAEHPVELKSGSLILLGNQLYRFDV